MGITGSMQRSRIVAKSPNSRFAKIDLGNREVTATQLSNQEQHKCLGIFWLNGVGGQTENGGPGLGPPKKTRYEDLRTMNAERLSFERRQSEPGESYLAAGHSLAPVRRWRYRT
jgi:hypothetical protein